MKFIIPAKPFVAALRQASTLTKGNRLRIPVLGAARLSAADGAVTISATDLDAVLTLTIPAGVAEAGEIAVNVKNLWEPTASLPKEAVLTITAEGETAIIESGVERFELPAVPVNDLPPLFEMGEEAGRAALARKDAVEVFGRVAFAMSREDTRYYLNGAYLHAADGHFMSVTTDGCRLAHAAIRGAGDHWSEGVIIPANAVRTTTKLLAAHRDLSEVLLRQSKGLVEIAGGPFRLTSKVIDGTFPNYARAIGTPAGMNTITVDRNMLAIVLLDIATIAVAGKNKMAAAGLAWGDPEPDGHLRVCVAGREGNTSHVIPVENVRGRGRLAVQVRHAVDLLKAFSPSGSITLDAGDQPGAAPIWVVDAAGGPSDFATVQMPVAWPKVAP